MKKKNFTKGTGETACLHPRNSVPVASIGIRNESCLIVQCDVSGLYRVDACEISKADVFSPGLLTAARPLSSPKQEESRSKSRLLIPLAARLAETHLALKLNQENVVWLGAVSNKTFGSFDGPESG